MMSRRQRLGRNDLCWCGSGRKFKKCHLHRQREQPENPYEALKKTAAFNRKPMCLHPNAPGECSDKIVRAHTIQRGSSLSRIAENGHVLGFSTDARVLEQNDGRVGVRRIGINQASTFMGFCSHHDNATFSPVEDRPFIANDEQCFLLGYRAMCRELYQKITVLDAMDYMRTLDRGRPVEEQVRLQSILDGKEQGYTAGRNDLLDRKSDFDKILLAKSFSDMSNYVIFTKDTPDILATFGVTVDFDFQGNRLQNLSNADQGLDALYVSIIATTTGGAIVLVWRDSQTDACTQFVQSLAAMTDQDVPDAIVRLVFEYCENTFFRPSWWNALDKALQSTLLNRITTSANVLVRRRPNCLFPDGNRYVNWTIVRRQTNRIL